MDAARATNSVPSLKSHRAGLRRKVWFPDMQNVHQVGHACEQITERDVGDADVHPALAAPDAGDHGHQHEEVLQDDEDTEEEEEGFWRHWRGSGCLTRFCSAAGRCGCNAAGSRRWGHWCLTRWRWRGDWARCTGGGRRRGRWGRRWCSWQRLGWSRSRPQVGAGGTELVRAA